MTLSVVLWFFWLLSSACVAVRYQDAAPVEICSIQNADDPGGEPVRVYLLPDNGRAFSFGDHFAQSTVQCKGVADCSSSAEPVSNAENCPPCPCDVADSEVPSASITEMFGVISPVCNQADQGHPVDVLSLGLGGGTLHRHLRRACPSGTRVRSVEIDPRVAGVAERYFGLEVVQGVSEIEVADALTVVKALAASRNSSTSGFLQRDEEEEPAMGATGWDIVAIDCFITHGEIPIGCRSPEFVNALHAILKPSGVLLQHVWHYSPENNAESQEFYDLTRNYNATFGNAAVSIIPIPRKTNAWDDILVAHMADPEW